MFQSRFIGYRILFFDAIKVTQTAVCTSRCIMHFQHKRSRKQYIQDNNYVLFSHVGPSKPSAHWQVKLLIPSSHVPPLRQESG